MPICKCCEPNFDPPLNLKLVPHKTQLKRLPVLLCKHCDGYAFELAQRTEKQYFDPDNPDNYTPPETV